jgi:type I restriction enzyme S subunit
VIDKVGGRSPAVPRGKTKTGGRPATLGVIPGRYSLSVGNPETWAPRGWRWTPLTEVARLETGHTPSRKHPEYWGGDIPWIGIRDATENHGRTLDDTKQHTNDLGIANSSARLLPAHTVCLSRTASVGYVVVTGRPMATSQDFVNWVCSDQIDYNFLKYVLLSEHDSFLTFASGTTHQTIYFPEVKAFHVCLPPVEVQNKIVAVLSAYDGLIENNNRRIKVLKEMAQRIYREWFVDFRFPGYENVPLVDSELGPIPEKWEVGVLDDLVVLQRGFDLPKSERKDGIVPIIAATGRNGTHNEARVLGPGVVTGRSGSLGSVEYVVESFWPLNTTLWAKEYRRATPEYAYFLLRQLDLAGFNSGAAVPTLNRNDIRGLPQALPPAPLIESFSVSARDILGAVRVLEISTDVLGRTRDFLLSHLISGEVDVSDLKIVMPDAAP